MTPDGTRAVVLVEGLSDQRAVEALAVRLGRDLAAEGDLLLFRKFQRQPAQRDKPVAALLRRFLGTRSGRKIHYGTALVNALDLERIPTPLEHLLARV
jgi:hypothetical protein